MNTYLKWGSIAVLVAVIAGDALFFLGNKSTVTFFAIESNLLPREWQYKGFYTTPEQIAKAQANIKTFQGRVGGSTEEKYDIAVSIAQEYMHIGQGKEAYEYLLRAEKIDPINSITYQTMGTLFESTSALDAAEQAFKKGIETQPHIAQNHLVLIEFYKRHNKEALTIDDTFVKALNSTDRNINLLKEYGQWLEGENRYSDSLSAWEEVFARDPNTAVERKVSQLKKLAK